MRIELISKSTVSHEIPCIAIYYVYTVFVSIYFVMRQYFVEFIFRFQNAQGGGKVILNQYKENIVIVTIQVILYYLQHPRGQNNLIIQLLSLVIPMS